MWRIRLKKTVPAEPAVAALHNPRELLLSYLSDQERHTFTEHGFFYVVGGDGHVYALTNGWNVWVVNRHGKLTDRLQAAPLCGTHGGSKPCIEGRLVGQLLALKTNPGYLRGAACHIDLRYGGDGVSMYMRGAVPEALLCGAYFGAWRREALLDGAYLHRRSRPRVGPSGRTPTSGATTAATWSG